MLREMYFLISYLWSSFGDMKNASSDFICPEFPQTYKKVHILIPYPLSSSGDMKNA